MDQLPQEFGQSGSVKGYDDQIYERYQLQDIMPGKVSDSGADSDEDSDDGDSDDDDDLSGLPITHRFRLKSEEKSIESLGVSSLGTSLVSTSADTSFSLFNFQSMNPSSLGPTITTSPYETKYIHTIDINKNDEIIVLSEDSSFKVLSLKGEELSTFNAGDRYIYDVRHTKGHTGSITDGFWIDSNKILTGSVDSTFRIWDYKSSKQDQVNFVKSKGKKVKISLVSKSNDSKLIFAADDTKRLTIWNQNSFNRPISELSFKGKIVSLATNDSNDHTLLIRTDTNELKLYDLRNLQSPIMQNLEFANHPSTSSSLSKVPLIFSNNHIYAPIMKDSKSYLSVLDSSDLYQVKTLPFESEITALSYSTKLNQICVGLHNGDLSVLFNPITSTGGVKISITNKPRKRHLDEDDSIKTAYIGTDIGFNMDELQKFNRSKKKKDDDDDNGESKPQKQKFIWGTTNANKIEDSVRDLEDPREALLKYAKK